MTVSLLSLKASDVFPGWTSKFKHGPQARHGLTLIHFSSCILPTFPKLSTFHSYWPLSVPHPHCAPPPFRTSSMPFPSPRHGSSPCAFCAWCTLIYSDPCSGVPSSAPAGQDRYTDTQCYQSGHFTFMCVIISLMSGSLCRLLHEAASLLVHIHYCLPAPSLARNGPSINRKDKERKAR